MHECICVNVTHREETLHLRDETGCRYRHFVVAEGEAVAGDENVRSLKNIIHVVQRLTHSLRWKMKKQTTAKSNRCRAAMPDWTKKYNMMEKRQQNELKPHGLG